MKNAQRTSDNDVQRHEMFQIVCDQVTDWRDFGRCCDFTDVELSRIGEDENIRNKIPLIMYRILEQAEERFGNKFQEKLCTALIDAKRKDILRKLHLIK